ncbi:MAG TPA: tripartite tricarboxylate transporter substrate-binding protein [Xanthobacteraceae bacterium]|jgi:tripartite-type tricarboxylate transporter receptor subunit TctC|nr:tripartite tricarboxylate transporter substrate-binding protein [Xanthobacteraceae bacterium]
MKSRRRTLLHWLAATSAASLTSRFARGQSFPARPITIVVPFPAGGPTDTLGRVLADRMKNSLGQSVIIENLTGAAGTIGSTHVARSPPDGYTLILGHWQTHVVNGATYTLPFDVVNDFAPISLIADCPMWLVGGSGLAAQNLRELIAWMKESPGKATVGIGGAGGGADVVGTYFQKNTGTRFQFVPYRGAAPIMQDLLAGHIDLTFTLVASALAQVRSGQVKAYAVMARARWAEAPDTPPSDEGGVPGLYASFWHGLWAPKATPPNVIVQLDRAVVESVADPAVHQKFIELGQEPWPRDKQTPDGLAAQQKAEIEKWWPIIKAAGIRAE